MIILSGVLVVLAIALLVTGIVTGNTGHEILGLDGLKLIYVSIGVSIISALCLAIGVFLRRKELFGSAESGASSRRSAAGRSARAARTAKTKAKARVGAGDDAPVTVTPATAAEVPAETSVYVVPGRKRYHLETCRQLAGRDKEELTFVEAREEGFTACTACLPDTALAARAAITETADAAPTESLDTVADTTDRAEDDPALATRTDLPVTKLDADTTPDLGTDEDERADDAGSGTREIDPVAESPAAAELTESPGGTSTEASADTARFDEVPEADETSDSAAEERSLARSRSLFEPLARDDAAVTDDATTETPATEDTEDTEDKAAEDAEVETAAADDISDDLRHEDAADETLAEPSVAHEEAGEEHADEAERDGDTWEPDGEPAAAAPADTGDDTGHDDEDADAGAAEHPDLPFVRILSGTKRYHRPDCALIEDIAEDADDLETLSPAEAKERGCTPCLVCQPDKDPSDLY